MLPLPLWHLGPVTSLIAKQPNEQLVYHQLLGQLLCSCYPASHGTLLVVVVMAVLVAMVGLVMLLPVVVVMLWLLADDMEVVWLMPPTPLPAAPTPSSLQL